MDFVSERLGAGSRHTDLTSHYQSEPTTLEGIADRLEDSNALPEAEAYQFVKPELAREIILEVAEELFDYVRKDYFTTDEALRWYRMKLQPGHGGFGVQIDSDGNRQIFESSDLPKSHIPT